MNWIGTSGEAIDESKADLMKGCTAVRAGVVSQAPASAGGTTDVEAARQ